MRACLVIAVASVLAPVAGGGQPVAGAPDAGTVARTPPPVPGHATTAPQTAATPTPASAPLEPCDAKVLAAAAEADTRMRENSDCEPAALEALVAAVRALDACAGQGWKPADRWTFPIANVSSALSIGGRNGSGYQPARRLPCYATKYPGHPAHDLFVPDRPHASARDRQGKPFLARAVEDGLVLIAHRGWKPSDPGKGGNYVMLYLKGRGQVAYYAHLGEVIVSPGQRVAAGDVLGTVGRTGKNALPYRSPTHLHFGLWDAKTFRPVDSYKLLRAAAE